MDHKLEQQKVCTYFNFFFNFVNNFKIYLEFAGRLAKEGIRYQLKGMVADPEECDVVIIYSFQIPMTRN